MMKERRTSDLIKEKINCFDLIDKFNLQATRTYDGSYRTYSFTHEGANPTSMQIWKDNWYCHSSKMSGDSISMYAWLKYKGDNSLAFRDLMQMLGLGTNEEQFDEFERYKESINRVQANINQYHRNMRPEHYDYFHKRNIRDGFIDEYKCGYDPYDDRIIIPIWKDSRPVYWCARAFDNSKVNKTDYPKYKKPSLGFNLCFENELYGYDTLKRKNSTLWIAEGVFDFISLWQEGKTVLCNATGMSKKHIEVVTRIARDYDQVNICFDNDTMGNKFAKDMFKSLFENNVYFKIIDIPSTYNGVPIKDISDAYCNGLMPDELEEKYSTNGVERYLETFYKKTDDLRKYIHELSPYMTSEMRCIVDEYIGTHIDAYFQKMLRKALNREKTQQEFAKDFIKRYKNDLWFYKQLNILYEFDSGYWKPIDEINLRREFEDLYDVRNNEEKAIFDKIKVQTVDKTNPIPNDRECFNVKNGTIYFDKTNKEQPYRFEQAHQRNDYCVYQQEYEYDPKADDSIFMNTLHQIFANHPQGEENMIMRYEEYLGSIFLNRNPEQKAIMFVGDGSNGKSILTSIIQLLLGTTDLYCALTVPSLSREFRLQTLIGKKAQFFHDPKSDTYESEDLMKTIIDNSEMTTNVKNKDPITFQPTASVFIDANELFHPKDKSGGWLRRFDKNTHYLYNRFSFIESEVNDKDTFKADNELLDKLSQPKVLSSILNHALKGYERLVKNDLKYTLIPDDPNMKRDLYSAGNHLFLFASEFDFYVNGLHHTSITADNLYSAYRSWYSSKGYLEKFALSQDSFFKRIEFEFRRANRTIEKRTPNNKRIYVNLEDS